MSTNLAAIKRIDETGKGAARKLRAKGRIPAVVYGGGKPATAISVDSNALLTIFRITGNRNTVVKLELDGEEIPCLVRESQRNPLTRQLLHVDFYQVDAEVPVTVMVPVVTVGESAGAALGGRIRIIRRELPVFCTYQHIPDALELDVTELELGNMMRASAISMPEGVRVALDTDINVVTCYGRTEPTAEELAEEEGGEGEEGEEGEESSEDTEE